MIEAFLVPDGWLRSIDLLGYLAAGLTIATYSMKTMIPLRVASICASCLFILYGYLQASYPQLVLHAVLLPLNAVRLRQMIQLIDDVKNAAQQGDHAMEWIKPWTRKQLFRPGEFVFRKGEEADCMYYVLSGRYRLEEIDVTIGPGQVVGEIGLVAADRRRTQSFRCAEEGTLLAMSYSDVEQLYFQNPRFGFYLLNLIGQRLLVNISQLEARLAAAPQHSGATAKEAAPVEESLAGR